MDLWVRGTAVPESTWDRLVRPLGSARQFFFELATQIKIMSWVTRNSGGAPKINDLGSLRLPWDWSAEVGPFPLQSLPDGVLFAGMEQISGVDMEVVVTTRVRTKCGDRTILKDVY